MIKALIIDDEVKARNVLKHYLENFVPEVTEIRQAESVDSGLEILNFYQPDIVFLDVEMPELDGFGVVSNLDPAHKPVVVFVTANEEFARKAFDVQALDYLIKPAQRSRLKLALERARHQLELQRALERESLRNGPRP